MLSGGIFPISLGRAAAPPSPGLDVGQACQPAFSSPEFELIVSWSVGWHIGNWQLHLVFSSIEPTFSTALHPCGLGLA